MPRENDQGRRDVCPVHFPECRDDLTHRHSPGIKEKDFVIHRCKTALVLFNGLGLKAAGPVTWGVQLKLAIFSLQGLGGEAVAAIFSVRLLMDVHNDRQLHRIQDSLLPVPIEVSALFADGNGKNLGSAPRELKLYLNTAPFPHWHLCFTQHEVFATRDKLQLTAGGD